MSEGAWRPVLSFDELTPGDNDSAWEQPSARIPHRRGKWPAPSSLRYGIEECVSNSPRTASHITASPAASFSPRDMSAGAQSDMPPVEAMLSKYFARLDERLDRQDLLLGRIVQAAGLVAPAAGAAGANSGTATATSLNTQVQRVRWSTTDKGEAINLGAGGLERQQSGQSHRISLTFGSKSLDLQSCMSNDKENGKQHSDMSEEDEEDHQRREQADELASKEIRSTTVSHSPRRRRTQKSHTSGCSGAVRAQMTYSFEAVDDWVLGIVRHRTFEMASAMVIISNSIVIGTQVEYSAAKIDAPSPWPFFAISHLYAACFFFELVMRLLADRLFFLSCKNSDFIWNYLDIIVVVSSLVEVALDIVTLSNGEVDSDGQESGNANVRILRLVRIVRLIRVIRVLKIVRFIRALRTLVYSIVCTLRSLFWATILLVIILYFFAILFTQASVDHMKANDSRNPPELVKMYWDSLPKSMFTLFKVVSGGVTWESAAEPLATMGWLWVVAFIVYVVFALFAVMNVITGVFCQSAIESAQHDYDLVVQSQINEKKMYLEKIRQLFRDTDKNESGAIDIHEFEQQLQNEKVQAYLSSLQLDTQDAWTLFKLLDVDDDNTVTLEEFVSGCMRMKGNAKAMEVAALLHEQKQMRRRMHRFFTYTEKAMAALAGLHGLEMPPPKLRMTGSTNDSSQFDQ